MGFDRFCYMPSPRSIALCLSLFSLAIAGCGNQTAIMKSDIRTYRIPHSERATNRTRSGLDDMQPVGGSLAIKYDVPDGWTDKGQSGIRLTTLLCGPDDSQQEISVTTFGGTLASNVSRWVNQLRPSANAADNEEVAMKALADAEVVDVGNSQATIVFLLDEKADATDDGTAILGAIIPTDDTSSIFVKLKSPVGIARKEQKKFLEFVSSLRWE